MRYPLLAFFFVFVMPPFAAHALLTGRAEIAPVQQPQRSFVVSSTTSPADCCSHRWTLARR